jgi:hypothetical protein
MIVDQHVQCRQEGFPGLQSRATMDALLPFHDQGDTPDRTELGITHLATVSLSVRRRHASFTVFTVRVVGW